MASSPIDDRIAYLLSQAKFSFRQIGQLLSLSDKTAKAAAARGTSVQLGAAQEEKLKELLEFFSWFQQGESRGYIAWLVDLLSREGSK